MLTANLDACTCIVEKPLGSWVDAELNPLVDPVFGYTLERLRGIIMRCSDRHIAHRSPSLLGSYVRSVWFGQKVAIEDGQCLDHDSRDKS